MALEKWMSTYLDEKWELGHFDIKRVAGDFLYLVGRPNVGSVVGFVRFAEAEGVKAPKLRDFTSDRVERYEEFIRQHIGTLHAACARRAVLGFWEWGVKNDHLSESAGGPTRKQPRWFRVQVSIQSID